MNIYKDSYSKGDRAEKRVSKVLEELEKEEIIESFGWTFAFSRDDLEGVDFLIYPKKGKEIPLQVKSSYQKEHEKKYISKGIYCLVVKPYNDNKIIKKNILEILERAEKQRRKND